MIPVGIIGSSLMNELQEFEQSRASNEMTPYGEPSGRLLHGELFGAPIVFLARHGEEQDIAPHQINYRANLWALQHAGVKQVIAVGAVGGISDRCRDSSLFIPDDLIDYTHGREQTIFDGETQKLQHIEFTHPYDEALRKQLCDAASRAGISHVADGIHGVVQGPRLETAAEIKRLERDGCDIVGMTGMPEASLARELNLAYACCGVIVNQAAGKGKAGIHQEIEATTVIGMANLSRLLKHFLAV